MNRQAELVCRRAVESDLMRVFEWANDPVVRAASFRSEPIALDDHRRWFTRALARPDLDLLIVSQRDPEGVETPVGQFRYDATTTEVSVAVAAAFRGKGLGAAVIVAGLEHVASHRPVDRVLAKIRPDNRASIRVFERAGFRPFGHGEENDAPCLIYAWGSRGG